MRLMIDRCAAVKAGRVEWVWRVKERSDPHIREEDRGAQRNNRAERNKRKQISSNMTVTMAT